MERIHELQPTWKKEKKENVVNRVLWTVIIVLFVIILIEVLFQFLIVPRLKIDKVIVENELSLTKEELLYIAGIDKNLYYFSLHTDEIEAKLEKYPSVLDASVEKKFPNILKLEVRKRVPLAITFIEDRGISLPGLIDQEGVVFHIGRLTGEYNLPVISGLEFRAYSPGMRLPGLLVSFLEQLSLLKKNARTLYDFISEIKIIPIGNNDFELLFYMIPYTTHIRCGNSVDKQVLTYGMMVLDVLDQQGMTGTVKEIDFRSKEIVYKHQGGGDA
jgi:cell division protein FtsQ